jgi:acyl carrier protein
MQQYVEQDLYTLKEMLRRLLGREESVGDDEDIYEAGLTSIMVLPLLSEIEDAFGLTVPDADFLDTRTPRALAQMVQRLRTN